MMEWMFSLNSLPGLLFPFSIAVHLPYTDTNNDYTQPQNNPIMHHEAVQLQAQITLTLRWVSRLHLFLVEPLHTVTKIKGWYLTRSGDLRPGQHPCFFQVASEKYFLKLVKVLVFPLLGDGSLKGMGCQQYPKKRSIQLYAQLAFSAFVKHCLSRRYWFPSKQPIYQQDQDLV